MQLHTPPQARQTRCCGPDGCGIPSKQGRLCVAFDCMAWQWGPDGYQQYDGLAAVGEPQDDLSTVVAEPMGTLSADTKLAPLGAPVDAKPIKALPAQLHDAPPSPDKGVRVVTVRRGYCGLIPDHS